MMKPYNYMKLIIQEKGIKVTKIFRIKFLVKYISWKRN